MNPSGEDTRIVCTKKMSMVEQKLRKDPRHRMARNAATQGDSKMLATDWDAYARTSHVFSNVVSGELPITNQNKSGRCWLFAALNLLRIHLARKYKLDKFEFSQSYLFFYDKLEKANYFLENILATGEESYDSRLMMHLLQCPVQDGGQWDMAVALILKYGLLPQSAYPDSEANLNSSHMNYIITLKLREYASRLRALMKKGADAPSLKREKDAMVEEIYYILTVHMGAPPKRFDWEFYDKDKKFHGHPNLTPQEFLLKYVKYPFDQMVCLVHSPRITTPYNKLYTIDYLGNVIEGQIIKYINVEMSVLKQAAIASIKADEPLWFGCDVGKALHRDLGIMDIDLFDFDMLYNTTFTMSKADRMNYGESQMTHAMLLNGVHLVNDQPKRWRVENSWGEKCGEKGFFVMSDSWADEYLFELAVNKKYLSKEIAEIANEVPVHLFPWDPLGALA